MVLKTFRVLLVLAVLGAGAGEAGRRPDAGGPWPGPVPPGAGPQPGATLRGRVEIGHALSSSRPAQGDRSSAQATDAAQADVYRQAVVFLDPPPNRVDRPGEARARMTQKNERFLPHVLAIQAGTVVEFPNEDRIYHNVFSLSKPRRFDLGRYAAGKSKAVRFDRPGIVRVFCEIHSHMNAFIVVFDHRFFAVTDDQGRFRIDRVPPGSYRLTAWYEGVLQETQTVTVTASGADVTFELKQDR